MSLKSRFLSLSMKEQICIAIIFLHLFCLGAILAICCSFAYQILMENYKQKKLYFFNKYKEYLHAGYYFHNYCLLGYEELLRRFQKQAWKFHQVLNIYNDYNLFDNYSNSVVFYKDEEHKNIISKKDRDNTVLFTFPMYRNESSPSTEQYIHQQIYSYTYLTYQSLSNALMSHDIGEYFYVPFYTVPIMKTPLFTNINALTMMSHNASSIHEKLIEIQQGDVSTINYNLLTKYYKELIPNFLYDIFFKFGFYFSQKLGFFQLMFNKAYNEIYNSIEIPIDLNSQEFLYYFASKSSGYFSRIDYSNDKVTIISISENENYYHCETSIIDNYLCYMNSLLLKTIDVNFIPLYFGNNTILSKELCISFILKVNNFIMNINTLNELNNKIFKGKTTIENLFINKDIDIDPDMKDILNTNYSSFLRLDNLFYEGLMYLVNKKNGFPHYFFKYSYPNFNALKDFKSEYLIIDQVNYYFFSSFRQPIKYTNLVKQVLDNCFYLIVSANLYIWLICMAINLIIFSKVIENWIQPINKLQEAIESNSIKDENIFKYSYDNIINELFSTCKELLIGQINNNKYDIDNFNISSLKKNKKIDENRYKKNLIIDNDLMNQLINQQQNTMDFSKNIALNDPNNKLKNQSMNKNKLNLNKNKYDEKKENLKNLISENDKNSKDISNNSLKADKNKKISNNNELYKKLFQIGEYIDYYRNKLQPNNIIIIGNNNSINDENKITKSVSKKISLNSKYLGTNDNNEKIYINMLDEQNISYLWYMEEKKKNNKSFNYNINDNYNELFID